MTAVRIKPVNMDPYDNLPEAFSNWSFASQRERSATQVSLWRMDLPPDPLAATEQLAQVETQVTGTQVALQAIPERIQDLIAELQETGSVSFDAASEPLPEPERELLRWLESTERGDVSFGTENIPQGELITASQGLQQAIQNLLRALTQLAWIETGQAGLPFARTAVDWTGDQDTAWERRVTPQQFALHQRSVRLAIASRLALLRLLIVVIQGATKLSLLIATPGASLLALPAAWKFANNVLVEVKNLKAV